MAACLVVGACGIGAAARPAAAAVRLRPKAAGLVSGRGSGKLSPRLATLAGGRSFASARAAGAALSLPASGPGSLVREPGGRVLVEIRARDQRRVGVGAPGAGARVVNVSPRYSMVTAAVAPAALDAIAGDRDVRYVNEVLAPLTAAIGGGRRATTKVDASGACQPTVSEGDTLMNVAAARSADSVDGTGQTIGILSDSFDTDAGAATRAATDVASGDLPGPGNPCGETTPVTVQSDFAGGGQTDEGRGDGRARARSRARCASRVRDRGERRARLRESDQPAANGEPRDRASSTT